MAADITAQLQALQAQLQPAAIDQGATAAALAPRLVGPEKAARGKTPTDTWWNTIVSPNGKEKTGYPTQKPRAIIERIIKVHTNPGDRVLDFFAGRRCR